MAAITTLDTFGGTSDPLTSGDGWTIFEGTGFSESGGVATPKSYAADQGMVWSTAFTETDTQGTICKVIFSGGLEAGSEWRLIYDYTDSSNYRYVQILWKGITVASDFKKDVIRLWKVVAGVHSQVSGDTTTRRRQTEAGDLRHWQLQNRSTTFYPAVTILTHEDQHVVKVSVKDGIYDRDEHDMIILTEKDTRTEEAGKVGIYSVSGSQTTTINSFQAQLLNVKYTATTGNDTSGTGTLASPYKTIHKLLEQVAVNEHGFIAAGTYSENSNTNLVYSFNNGTSFEDAPTVMPKCGETVTQQCPGGGSYGYGIFSQVGKARYRVLYGWTLDGLGTGENGIRVEGQAATNSDATSKYVRIQQITCTGLRRPFRLFNQCFNQGTPVAADYETYFTWIDCTANGAWNSHGFYCTEAYMTLAYCRAYGSTYVSDSTVGLGFQLAEGNHTWHPTAHTRVMFCEAEDNSNAGFAHANGTDNIFFGCKSWNTGLTKAGGNAVGFQSYDDGTETFYINCISWNNQKYGFDIIAYQNRDLDVTGIHFIACTAYGNSYNYTINAKLSGSLVDDVLYRNCTAYNATTADYKKDFGIGTVDNVILTKNHEQNNPGNSFGTVYGDPLFEDAANGDFRIGSVSSPLYEAGSITSTWRTVDFTLRPLPQETNEEIGAYEYPSPPQVLPVLTMDTSANTGVGTPVSFNISVTDDNLDRIVVSITGSATITAPVASGSAVVKGFG